MTAYAVGENALITEQGYQLFTETIKRHNALRKRIAEHLAAMPPVDVLEGSADTRGLAVFLEPRALKWTVTDAGAMTEFAAVRTSAGVLMAIKGPSTGALYDIKFWGLVAGRAVVCAVEQGAEYIAVELHPVQLSPTAWGELLAKRPPAEC